MTQPAVPIDDVREQYEEPRAILVIHDDVLLGIAAACDMLEAVLGHRYHRESGSSVHLTIRESAVPL